MDKNQIEELKAHYEVSEEKLDEIIEVIYSKMTFEKSPQESPIAIVVGGQPGAGKSGLIDKTSTELPNSIVLDVDDFRYFHPDIKEILTKYPNDLATFTITFVNRIFKKILAKLMEKKFNLIMQKTLRDDEVIYDTLVPLKKAGYLVVLRVLAVSEIESKLSTLERSLAVKRTVGYCRWTPIKNQDYAINGLVPTTQHIFESEYCDVVQVFKRNPIPTDSILVYSKTKESSKDAIAKSLKPNKDLFLGEYGQSNYTDEVDAVVKTRDKNTLLDIDDFMIRIALAKRVMDEEGLKYLLELEELATDYYLKLNDLSEGCMNNNIKLELAKEVMARKIAMACKDGFNAESEELQLLLEEEREMNKFNTAVIDKIINQYGAEIKNGVNNK